ncbi:MAG: hypothetical protein R3D67_05820 [Hyphomicrobiaceae bacterium]
MFESQNTSANSGLPMFNFAEFWTGFGQLSRNVEPVTRSATRAAFEMQSLVGQRATAYLEIPQTIANCRTPVDLMTAQVAFWQRAGMQYQDAAKRMIDIWTSAARQTANQAGERVTPRDYITFPEPKVDQPASARRAA